MNQSKKLTQAYVRDLPLAEPGKRYTVNDTELPGFGVRVGARDRVYFVWGRVQGKKRLVTIGNAMTWTAEDARKQARALSVDMDKGDDPTALKAVAKSLGVTLAEAATDYVRENAKLKDSTRKEYVEILQRNLADWWDKPLAEITPDMVSKMHAKIKERAPPQADKTFKYFRLVFNSAAAVLELSGQTPPPNPVRVLTLKKAWQPMTRRQTSIPTEDIGRWWNACEGEGDRMVTDAFRFMLLTGMRKSEVIGLRWADVHFKRRTVTVRDTKNHSDLTLPVGDWLFTMLEDRRKQGAGHDYVFQSDKGRLSNLRYFQDDMLERTGLWITPHDLRRTFITMAAGMFPEYVVKALCNHKQSSDVTQGYIIQSVNDLRAPMQAIENRVLELAAQD